jgi:hypothetical protein
MSIVSGPKIITDGLILHLDAANEKSYPGTGDTWFDLSNSGANAELINSPTFTNEGAKSYFTFDGINDKINSININQEYRDLFIIVESENSGGGIGMVFGKYENQDYSFRISGNSLRTPPSVNTNDWHNNSISDVFINGKFNALNEGWVSLGDKWNFVRSHRTNEVGFGTSFRYEISSDFLNRRFKGKISLILCYNRKLTNTEVLQNFEAFRGRYGI